MLSLERAKRLECDDLSLLLSLQDLKLRQAAALQTLRAALTRKSIPVVSHLIQRSDPRHDNR